MIFSFTLQIENNGIAETDWTIVAFLKYPEFLAKITAHKCLYMVGPFTNIVDGNAYWGPIVQHAKCSHAWNEKVSELTTPSMLCTMIMK